MRQQTFHLGYRPALDGLRGISILAVLGFHAGIAWLGGGFLGVDIFFVLSGFLITALLCEEWERHGSISLKGFYIRRLRRLVPALVAMLVLYTIAMLILHRGGDLLYPLRSVLLVLLYVANWAMMADPASIQYHLGHAWSLSIEEQFYLIWPLLLLWLFRKGISRRDIVLTVIVGLVASACVHLVLWREGASFSRVYYGLDTRAFSLLAGCLVGLMTAWGMLPASPRARRWFGRGAALSVAALAVLTVISVFGTIYPAGSIYLAASAAAAVIVIALMLSPSGRLARLLGWPPLVWIGRLSYSLYLWHFPIYAFFHTIMPRERYGLMALLPPTIVTFIAAIASYYGIERRFYQRTPKPVPTPDPVAR